MPAYLIRIELISSLSSCNAFLQISSLSNSSDAQGWNSCDPSSTSDEAVCFTAEDSSVGIRADIKDTLFSPLFTNKARATGLSLAVSKRIVELHDGAIVVERDEGRGARFVLRLLEWVIRPLAKSLNRFQTH